MFLNLIFFVLPFNLGYHFVLKHSYVGGVLVDYLIPTIYLQDIVAFLFNMLMLFLFLTKKKKPLIKKHSTLVNLTFLFIASLFFTYIGGSRTVTSLEFLLRNFNYWVTFLFITTFYTYTELKRSLKFLYISLSFVCLLAFLQLLHQGSIFDNYLFFGEQPYTFLTKGVLRESLFGYKYTPPYATFRHPNIFVGFTFISALLIGAIYKFPRWFRNLCVLLLLLTQSINLFISFVFTFMNKMLNKKLSLALIFGVFLMSLCLHKVPASSYLDQRPSFYIRQNLVKTSYKVFYTSDKKLFGEGAFSSLSKLNPYKDVYEGNRAVQPVHNVFLIYLLDFGVIGFLLYLSIFIFVFIFKYSNPFAPAILGIFLLSLFDHYFFSIHQTVFLFWLTLAFLLSYNYQVE